MAITIEVPRGVDALGEFVQFHDRVYRDRAIRWSAPRTFQLPVLLGRSPFTEGRTMRPLALSFYGPVWLVAAWCELRNDFRAFRPDRIESFTVLDETFRAEPGQTLRDFLDQMARDTTSY